MMTVTVSSGGERLYVYGLFGGVLSAAGLPIYIFAPKFFADTYGVSLSTLGVVLLALRLIDVVQDPLLGWLSARLGDTRKFWISIAGAIMALSMVGLFAIQAPIAPTAWFAICLVLLFSAFSFLSISFYALGVAKASDLQGGHTRLAGWREAGALLGVCLAAMLPTLLGGVTGTPFSAFAIVFALAVLLAVIALMPEWRDTVQSEKPTSFSTILSDKTASRLLLLALINAAPVAVSSTLFLFFVESRLEAPGWEGPLLVLFFLAAAISAPIWASFARRFGERRVLLVAMTLSIATFLCVLALGAGDTTYFAVICIVSGATIGADMTLLPALFARRMEKISPNAATGFGLWSTVSKFTLALAAVILLPILDYVGFASGAPSNTTTALLVLSLLYALVPCILKLISIVLLLAIPLEEQAK